MSAKNGLILSAALLCLVAGFLIYQTFSYLKSENEQLAQTNQELKQQMASLEEKFKTQNTEPDMTGTLVNGCRESECLVRMGDGYNSYLIGIGILKGFYRSVQREAWGETKDCDTLVLIGGSESLVSEYRDFISRGNTVNSIDGQNRVQFNLNLSQVTAIESAKIRSSTETNPVELGVLAPLPGGKDAPVCDSFADILQVK